MGMAAFGEPAHDLEFLLSENNHTGVSLNFKARREDLAASVQALYEKELLKLVEMCPHENLVFVYVHAATRAASIRLSRAVEPRSWACVCVPSVEFCYWWALMESGALNCLDSSGPPAVNGLQTLLQEVRPRSPRARQPRLRV